MLTTNPNLLRYLEKLETNTLSGWKKDTDGKTYSKFFVAAHQRGLVQTVLAFLAQAEGGVMPTLSQLVRDDEAGDMIQGQQTIKYKLTVDAAILEPILKREGMTLDGTGKSGV